jgi:hypothetical protein
MVCGTEICELSAAEIPLGKVKDEVFEQTLLPQAVQKLRKPVREVIGTVIDCIVD